MHRLDWFKYMDNDPGDIAADPRTVILTKES